MNMTYLWIFHEADVVCLFFKKKVNLWKKFYFYNGENKEKFATKCGLAVISWAKGEHVCFLRISGL